MTIVFHANVKYFLSLIFHCDCMIFFLDRAKAALVLSFGLSAYLDYYCMICSGGTFVWLLLVIVFHGNVVFSPCCYDLCYGCYSFITYSNTKVTVQLVFPIIYSWK